MVDPNVYDNVFGGANVSPTDLNYAAYSFSADLVLAWPFEALPDVDIATSKVTVTPLASGLKFYMPKANLVTPGEDCLITNIGAFSITVVKTDGAQIVVIPPGIAWLVYVTDNSTEAGTWASLQYGAGSSSADAAALAGAGLRANLTKLDQNLVTTGRTAGYAVASTDRATVLQNDGGTVVYTLAGVVAETDGFFFYAINAGTGNLTLNAAPTTIDGASTKILAPAENAMVFYDGTEFHTLGYGRALVNTVSFVSIVVPDGGTSILTAVQVLAQVQNLVGTINSNTVLEYGTPPGYWFVRNDVTQNAGATLTARVNSLDAGAELPAGSLTIIRSDGTNLEIAYTLSAITLINTAAGELTGGSSGPTVNLGLANTAVVAGTFGDASHTVTGTVDAKGRMTAFTSNLISIVIAQVQAFTSAALRGQITDETGGGLAVFNDAPALINPTVTTQAVGTNNTTAASTAYVQGELALHGIKTGDVKWTLDDTLQAGYVWLNGTSIGSATSGATGRANADTANLYAFMWNKYSDTLCPVATGRGADAATDFAANKALTMLTGNGKVFAMPDTIGGVTVANLGTGDTGGFAGAATLGASGGEKSHTLITAEIAAHVHTYAGINAGTTSNNDGGATVGAGGPAIDTSSTGGGASHNNVQATLVVNAMVAL